MQRTARNMQQCSAQHATMQHAAHNTQQCNNAGVGHCNVQEHLALNPMPREFASTTATYLCNDCNLKSTGAYHFLGLQVHVCHSVGLLQSIRAVQPCNMQHYQTDTPLTHTLSLSAVR